MIKPNVNGSIERSTSTPPDTKPLQAELSKSQHRRKFNTVRFSTLSRFRHTNPQDARDSQYRARSLPLTLAEVLGAGVRFLGAALRSAWLGRWICARCSTGFEDHLASFSLGARVAAGVALHSRLPREKIALRLNSGGLG
jgi:hypothetical protein